MSRSLTQAEASRLVRGEATGAVGGGAEVVGFTSNGGARLSRERESFLVGIYSRFANVLQTYLQGRLKTTVDVAVGQSEIVSFSEYQASLDNPCSVFHFDLGVGAGAGDGLRGMVDIGMRLPMLMVEVQFGGKASGEISAKRQELTVIEQQSVRGLVDRLLNALQDVWSQHVLFNPSGVRYEGSPDAIEVMDRLEPVMVTYLDLAIKEGLGGSKETISVAIPARALEAFLSDRGRAGGHAVAHGAPFADVIGGQLMAAAVDFRVVMPPCTLTASEVLGLKAGSVLTLGVFADVELECLVQGELIARGTGVVERSRYQVQLTEVLDSPPTRPPVNIPRGVVLSPGAQSS